jgi:tripartite-type tricarboxylate transporter receptor subunit TctC
MLNPTRRQTLLRALASSAAVACPVLRAQPAYPSSPIKIVIPTAPGGGYDTMMRLIGQKLTEAWRQPVIVEAKPGASGAIAALAVAKALPDGYTVLLNYSAFLSNLELPQSPGYKLTDFVPVGMVALAPIALGVSTSLNVRSLAEFVAIARARPGGLSYGSYGQGSGGHFVGELLKAAARIHVVHIPYKGEAPMLQDMLAGQIEAGVASLGGVVRYTDKIRPLAVASATRSSVYPNVPTFAEAGFPSVDMPGWGGLFAPAGTPGAIVARLSAEVARIVRLPDVSAKIQELGFEPVGWAPAQFEAFLERQHAMVRKLVADKRVTL